MGRRERRLDRAGAARRVSAGRAPASAATRRRDAPRSARTACSSDRTATRRGATTCSPGLHAFGSDAAPATASCGGIRGGSASTVQPLYGLRRDDLIQDPGRGIVERRPARDTISGSHERRAAQERGAQPSIRLRTVTDWARSRRDGDDRAAIAREVELVAVTPAAPRPSGPRFGTLVHATLATVALDATADADRGGREPAGAHPRRAGGRSRGGDGGRRARRLRTR